MNQEIPPRDRAEWVEIIEGKHKMEKYVLQLQVDRARKSLESGEKNMDEAVDYLYQYFLKYPKGFRSDLLTVFKQW